MSNDESASLSSRKSGSIAQYREKLAATLTKSARSLAFNMDNKRIVRQTAGIRPQFKDRLFALLFICSFIFVLCVPIVAGSFYLLFVKSDQYMSESRFVVR